MSISISLETSWLAERLSASYEGYAPYTLVIRISTVAVGTSSSSWSRLHYRLTRTHSHTVALSLAKGTEHPAALCLVPPFRIPPSSTLNEAQGMFYTLRFLVLSLTPSHFAFNPQIHHLPSEFSCLANRHARCHSTLRMEVFLDHTCPVKTDVANCLWRGLSWRSVRRLRLLGWLQTEIPFPRWEASSTELLDSRKQKKLEWGRTVRPATSPASPASVSISPS
jgi:hypothetical protein